MNTQTLETVTSDLGAFGSRERKMLIELLISWAEQDLPHGFVSTEVRPCMNHSSGHVFLSNEDFQVAMLNGSKLEEWFHCANCGNEGFKEDCEPLECGYCTSCVDKDEDLPEDPAEDCEESND